MAVYFHTSSIGFEFPGSWFDTPAWRNFSTLLEHGHLSKLNGDFPLIAGL
jgi:hypothetical protein